MRESFQFWTGKLGDSSSQLSYAVLAANWAVFGTVEKIIGNTFALVSITAVLVGLATNLICAYLLGNRIRQRIEHAEEDPARWELEFLSTAGQSNEWPYASGIQSIAAWMRGCRVAVPLAAGIAFVVAIIFP